MCCLLSCLPTRLLLSAEQGFSTSLEARCTAVPSFSVCQLYNIKGEIQDESSLKSRARNNSCRSRDVQPSVWKHRIRVSGLSHLRQDSNMLWVRFLQGKGLPLLGTHLGPSRTVLKSSRCQSDQGPVSRKPLWLEHCTPSAGFPREQSPACWRDAGGPPHPPNALPRFCHPPGRAPRPPGFLGTLPITQRAQDCRACPKQAEHTTAGF